MAEAIINHLGVGHYQAASAGSTPTGFVHPVALHTLEQQGVPIGTPTSQSWDEFQDTHFDLVITVCDQAAGEACPVMLGNPERRHWSIPDPAKTTGSDEKIQQAFELAFTLIKQKIEKELL